MRDVMSKDYFDSIRKPTVPASRPHKSLKDYVRASSVDIDELYLDDDEIEFQKIRRKTKIIVDK